MNAEPAYANQYILNIEELGEFKATQLAQQALDDYFFDKDMISDKISEIDQMFEDKVTVEFQEITY